MAPGKTSLILKKCVFRAFYVKNAVLCLIYSDLMRFRPFLHRIREGRVKRAKIAVKTDGFWMGLCKNRRQKMDFPPKMGIPD